MKYLLFFTIILSLLFVACNNRNQLPGKNAASSADKSFATFETRFMDAYWKQNPSASIFAGYGKYYDELKIPDSAAFKSDIAFAKKYLDSLHSFSYNVLSSANKIDYNILENQLHNNIWYIDTFRIQEWDPTGYNLGAECYELLNKKDMQLNDKLQLLSKHLQHADSYFNAAIKTLKQPTKEHTRLAAQQNEGSLEVFGKSLTDSIKASTLTAAEKDTIQQHVQQTVAAINNFVARLKKILADKNFTFRNFRIGENLFNQKFKYDIVTDHTAKEMFDKAIVAKKYYHDEMYKITKLLWPKYFGNQQAPADSLLMTKMMIDKISLNHASPEHVFDTIKQQVHDLEKFIIEKNLFAYDTLSPLIVRKMPAYMSGATLASASGVGGPYDKQTVAYYNVEDLSAMPREKAESQLREYNHYTLQILSIHEAMPGHCLQGVYSNKASSIVKAVFGNGAMVEGWAVYCEKMMLDNGWANDAPEMWLMFYKWSLRECCNVIVDYGIHCLNSTKDNVVKLLKNEAFQEDAQIEEKYHRATISQVQLCSYFTGATEIDALRDEIKSRHGSSFSLKDFHEKFLSYGSAPVKYIRELMLQ
jgi:uncharacterized protein (DUF885 family)